LEIKRLRLFAIGSAQCGFKENGENSFVGSGSSQPHNEEVFRLRKELADVKQERDILKKAVAIFSKAKG